MVSRRRTSDRVTRTLEERIDLYGKVLSLFKAGMRRGEIVREMKARFEVELGHSQVVDWTENGVSPYGRVHRFVAVPTPELAYLRGQARGRNTKQRHMAAFVQVQVACRRQGVRRGVLQMCIGSPEV